MLKMKVHQMTILLLPSNKFGGSQQRGAAGRRPLMTAPLLIASGREQAGFAVSVLSEFCASFCVCDTVSVERVVCAGTYFQGMDRLSMHVAVILHCLQVAFPQPRVFPSELTISNCTHP